MSSIRRVALVDCNSFYASCEQVFRPYLKDKPVVVVSNNDGCVVARSAKAKAIGSQWEYRFSKSNYWCQTPGCRFLVELHALGAMSNRVRDRLCSSLLQLQLLLQTAARTWRLKRSLICKARFEKDNSPARCRRIFIHSLPEDRPLANF